MTPLALQFARACPDLSLTSAEHLAEIAGDYADMVIRVVSVVNRDLAAREEIDASERAYILRLFWETCARDNVVPIKVREVDVWNVEYSIRCPGRKLPTGD